MLGAIGLGISAFGAYSSYKAMKEAKAKAGEYSAKSEAAMEKSIKATEEQLQYWQNEKSLWAAIYGDLEANVTSYYNTLTSSTAASELNQETFKQLEASKNSTLQYLSDRGLSSSGLAAQTAMTYDSTQAIALAYNAYNANKDVQAQKANFLTSYAAPQKNNIQQGIQAGQSNLVNAYGNQATAFANIASSYSAMANQSQSSFQNNLQGMAYGAGTMYLESQGGANSYSIPNSYSVPSPNSYTGPSYLLANKGDTYQVPNYINQAAGDIIK